MRKILARLETYDVVVFAYGAAIGVLILLFYARIPGAPLILGAHGAFLGVAAALIACASRFPWRGWRIARDWQALVIIPAAFRELHYLVHPIHPIDRHEALMAWDRALFGAAPTVALEPLLHPLPVEILQLCYASYYFFPVILGLALYPRGRRAEFAASLTLILLGFFSSYLGYFIVPALSPYFHEAALGHTRLWGVDPATLGYGLAPRIRGTLAALELEMRDCFPSGHVEVTLITLACAWRFHRPTFWGLVGPAAGLIVSTVYLRYHYTVDVLAGAAMAGVVGWGGPRLHRGWERWKKRPAAAAGLRVGDG